MKNVINCHVQMCSLNCSLIKSIKILLRQHFLLQVELLVHSAYMNLDRGCICSSIHSICGHELGSCKHVNLHYHSR